MPILILILILTNINSNTNVYTNTYTNRSTVLSFSCHEISMCFFGFYVFIIYNANTITGNTNINCTSNTNLILI